MKDEMWWFAATRTTPKGRVLCMGEENHVAYRLTLAPNNMLTYEYIVSPDEDEIYCLYHSFAEVGEPYQEWFRRQIVERGYWVNYSVELHSSPWIADFALGLWGKYPFRTWGAVPVRIVGPPRGGYEENIERVVEDIFVAEQARKWPSGTETLWAGRIKYRGGHVRVYGWVPCVNNDQVDRSSLPAKWSNEAG